MARKSMRRPNTAQDLGTSEETDQYPADSPIPLGIVVGNLTGEGEEIVVPGGWAGTDDDTSTAPSDQMGVPQPDELAEITGGALSDTDPVIEGGYESEETTDSIREALSAVDDPETEEENFNPRSPDTADDTGEAIDTRQKSARRSQL